MTLAAQPTERSRARLSPVTTSRVSSDESCRIEILENPIHRHDPVLAAMLEEKLRNILRDEGLGSIAVRFRVCRDESDAFQFICKVENPPSVDADVMVPWRWWSPLLANSEQFVAALEDGLRVRRARLSASSPRSADESHRSV